MKTLFLSLLILGVAIWFGVMLHNDSGYVLISYSQWTAEMPLWFFIVSLLLIIVSFRMIMRIISGLIHAPCRLSKFAQRKRMRKARTKMREGFIALAEGRWKDAEKLLTKSISILPNSLLSYLGAAIAAQQQGALERRDNYLRLAHGSTTLQLLRQLSPQHDYVLTLLKDVYTSLGEWPALLELVNNMKSRKLISVQEAEKLQVLANSMLLKNASSQSFSALETTWNKIDKHLKNNNELITAYINLLLAHDHNNVAEEVLRDYLKKHWDDKLVRIYGLLASKEYVKQLAAAETWLKAHPSNPILLLTLGRLSLRNQLWGKAKQYLQKSAELNPNVETYLELAAFGIRFPDEKLDYSSYVHKALVSVEEI